MPLNLTCSCGRSFAVGENFAGREVKCTYCGATQIAPGPGADSSASRCPHCGFSLEESGLTACPNCNENLLRHREESPRPETAKVVDAPPAVPDVAEKYILWEDPDRGVLYVPSLLTLLLIYF